MQIGDGREKRREEPIIYLSICAGLCLPLLQRSLVYTENVNSFGHTASAKETTSVDWIQIQCN